VEYRHLPLGVHDDPGEVLPGIWNDLQGQLAAGDKVVVHHDDLGDRLLGVMGGYLIHAGLVPEAPRATAMIERLVERPTGPARAVLAVDARVDEVTVAVRKLDPPVAQRLATSGVRITRSR